MIDYLIIRTQTEIKQHEQAKTYWSLLADDPTMGSPQYWKGRVKSEEDFIEQLNRHLATYNQWKEAEQNGDGHTEIPFTI